MIYIYIFQHKAQNKWLIRRRRVENYLRARALKHRTFRAFLEEVDAEYKDLVYHTEMRWLSRGRVLRRFVALKEEVLEFLKNEPKKFEKLESESWNHDLFLMISLLIRTISTRSFRKKSVDILVGRSLKAFKMKLRLFRSQLLKGEVTRFPTCAQHIPQFQHFELGETLHSKLRY